MEEVVNDIELNDNFEPKRNPSLLWIFDTLLPDFLIPLAVFSSAVSLSFISKGMNFFFYSFAGWPVSLLLMLALWIVSMPIVGLIMWKLSFVNSLFSLLKFREFRTSQVMLLLAVFASKMLHIALTRGNPSFTARLAFFIGSGIAILINMMIIIAYAAKFNLSGKICYAYAIEFVLFMFSTIYEFSEIEQNKSRK